jgi:hypothetical protein
LPDFYWQYIPKGGKYLIYMILYRYMILYIWYVYITYKNIPNCHQSTEWP